MPRTDPTPLPVSQTSNKRVIYVFLMILGVCILVSVILVVVFSRDSPDAEMITRLTWETPKENRRQLKFLPKTNHLKSVWTDADAMHPDDITKGGSLAREKLKTDWAAMGYSSTERGIVMAAGGYHYFGSAYVLVRELRHQGCTLPIEMWYRKGEMEKSHVEYMRQFGVQCLDLDQYVPFVIKHKFSIKVMSMYLSVFREILFLDADNNVLSDPSFLFDTPAYRENEALFWPDFWKLQGGAPCYYSFPEGTKPSFPSFQQESGQMVVNRERYWKQLWCVFRILENDLENLFPAPFNFGDKDLFHITWSATGEKFTFVHHRAAAVATVLANSRRQQMHTLATGQHAPDGKLLFVHQHRAEWADRRPEDTSPWWVYLKRHTKPLEGTVEVEYLNPTGPTKLELFREVVGNVEDKYVGFICQLRQQAWYREFYASDLEERGLLGD